VSLPLAGGVYINFFTHHFVFDVRWPLALGIVVVFRRCRVYFTVWRKRRSMPLVLSFVLIGFFIWVAENMASYLGAYVYAEQRNGWQVVRLGILSSWVLLVIVSFIIVAFLKHVRGRDIVSSVDGEIIPILSNPRYSAPVVSAIGAPRKLAG
jgi:uncharacterized membrane protein YoaT (DUF817 family)